MKPAKGVYIEAWLWVSLPKRHVKYTDEEIREIAREQWHKDGEIELDDDAYISRGEEW